VERHLIRDHKILKIPANAIESILKNIPTPSYQKPTNSKISNSKIKPGLTSLGVITRPEESMRVSSKQIVGCVVCHVCGCNMTKQKLSKHILKLHNGRNDENARKLYELERRHVPCQYCGKKNLVPMLKDHYFSHKKPVPDKQKWLINEYEYQVQILKQLTPSKNPDLKVKITDETGLPKKTNDYWREKGLLPEKAASGDDVFDNVRVLSGGAWGMGKK
jgi:hypothetical protein